MMINYSFTRRI